MLLTDFNPSREKLVNSQRNDRSQVVGYIHLTKETFTKKLRELSKIFLTTVITHRLHLKHINM